MKLKCSALLCYSSNSFSSRQARNMNNTGAICPLRWFGWLYPMANQVDSAHQLMPFVYRNDILISLLIIYLSYQFYWLDRRLVSDCIAFVVFTPEFPNRILHIFPIKTSVKYINSNIQVKIMNVREIIFKKMLARRWRKSGELHV